jgi:hypothetical protein
MIDKELRTQDLINPNPAANYMYDQNVRNSMNKQLAETFGQIRTGDYDKARYEEQQRIQRINAEKDMAVRVQKKADADNEELKQEYEDNRTHLRESEEYWNVAEGYKMGTQAHANDKIWSPYYWLYELPPMIGSSMSSPSQALSTAIKGVTTVAGIAAAPFSEGASLNLLWVGELAATPAELKGARDENFAEAGEKRVDTIINMLQDPSITKDVEG